MLNCYTLLDRAVLVLLAMIVGVEDLNACLNVFGLEVGPCSD